jgi:tRNA 2-thiouridine synthesizing protein C
MDERGLTLDDLMPLTYEDEDDDWAEKDSIIVVSNAEIAALMEEQDVILSF